MCVDAQQATDTLEIQQLLTEYCRAVDTRDWDRYRRVFTDDAVIDYRSSPFGIVGTVEEVIGWLNPGLSALTMTMHYVMNPDIAIDGDSATVIAQFYNPMQIPGFEELSTCGGYYHHTMTRTADGWRSTGMREEIVWFVNSPAG